MQYLDPRDVVADYKFPDFSKSYSGRVQSLKPEQIERLGGMMVWDLQQEAARSRCIVSRSAGIMRKAASMPALTGTYRVKLLNGREVDVMPVWQMYLVHFQDYDLDTVHQICRTPKDLIVRWARDSGTVKPAAIHNGEGTCHYFHMTINVPRRRDGADHTGNVGKFGTGQHTWSGNYKAGIWTATPWSGAGLAVHTGEDPFNITLDPNAHGKEIKTKSYYYGEEVGYWNHGDTALIVNTPKYGRKVFTGKTHMPTPSKFGGSTNVNMLNNAKHHYDMVQERRSEHRD